MPPESPSTLGAGVTLPTKPVYSVRVPEALRTVELGSSTGQPAAAPASSLATLAPGGPAAAGSWSERLLTCKRALDNPPYHNKWYAYKGLLNPYELVHVSSNRLRTHENVAGPLPLSRSYFKMWEMLHDFDLLDATVAAAAQPIRTAHFAEGPGGFIEAVAAWRERQEREGQEQRPTAGADGGAHKPTATPSRTTASRTTGRSRDVYAGITLRSTRRDVPGWGKSKRVLARYPQIQLHYGQDNTGNLYNVDNIVAFARSVGQGACALATGDGGIDYSVDFAQQEPLTFRLLLCQVYGGWLVLRRGGAFVCKLFDMYQPFTHDVLWLLAVTFDVVHLVKPHTSRPANSERYVVAKGFRGLPHRLSAFVQRVLRTWTDAGTPYPRLLATPPPTSFRRCLAEYNEWYAEQQCRNIRECLALIDGERARADGGDGESQQTEGRTPTSTAAVDAAREGLHATTGDESAYERLFQTRGTEPPSLSQRVLTRRFPERVHRQLCAARDWCAAYRVPLNPHNPQLRACLGGGGGNGGGGDRPD